MISSQIGSHYSPMLPGTAKLILLIVCTCPDFSDFSNSCGNWSCWLSFTLVFSIYPSSYSRTVDCILFCLCSRWLDYCEKWEIIDYRGRICWEELGCFFPFRISWIYYNSFGLSNYKQSIKLIKLVFLDSGTSIRCEYD